MNTVNHNMESKTTSKTTLFVVRLTAHEKKDLEKRSIDSGLTQSDYFRIQCLGKKPLRKRRSPSVNAKLLYQTLGQLGKVGNNINQIAKQYNNGFSQANENMQLIQSDLQAIREMIRHALGHIE